MSGAVAQVGEAFVRGLKGAGGRRVSKRNFVPRSSLIEASQVARRYDRASRPPRNMSETPSQLLPARRQIWKALRAEW